MAIKLSTLAKLAKNELCSGTAFLILLKIELPGLEAEDNIHVVANTEDIYWCDQVISGIPVSDWYSQRGRVRIYTKR